ncbi:MAG: formylglycine-generating enzyme family protein [Candidatus Eisenbacteria bacterium]
MTVRARAVVRTLVLALMVETAQAWPLVPPAGASAHVPGGHGNSRDADLVWIPAGHYRPLYKRPVEDSIGGQTAPATSRVSVPGFWLARHAVTNADYLAFVREHPEWRRSRAPRLFVDGAYLQHWRGDLDCGDPVLAQSPVVNVSWFAARAYCAASGGRLPTVDQWEYVGAANEHEADATREAHFQDRLRAWYSEPTPSRVAHVGSTFENVYGVWDMHGLVWEWTLDYSSALVSGESRADAALDRSIYCGSGATNATDFHDYAAFMRYAFRSSLSARYCVASLGFRMASDAGAPIARTGRDGR